MIRIRKITNPNLEGNLLHIGKVKEIMRSQFPDLSEMKIDEIGDHMTDPIKYKYQSALYVALNINEAVRGFALFLYMSDLQFCYLEYIAVSPNKVSSGVGGALYQRIREEALSLGALGLFFECLPDDPNLCRVPELIVQNQKRLAFYEQFGARPIANTLYESTVVPEDDCPPYLIFDGLGQRDSIPASKAQIIIKAILERKYGDYCPISYIDKVISSIQDDPVAIRHPMYMKNKDLNFFKPHLDEKNKIFLVCNDKHNIHHVKDRGYVESPVRIENIKKELDKTGIFFSERVEIYPEKFILDVHDKNYVRYFK